LVIKQGFNVFWRWLQCEILRCFEKLLEKFERLFRVYQNTKSTDITHTFITANLIQFCYLVTRHEPLGMGSHPPRWSTHPG